MSIDKPEPIGRSEHDEAAMAGPFPGSGGQSSVDGKRKKSTARVAAEWIVVLSGALVLALVLRAVLFQAYYIRFTSMEPTLQNGDRVLVNKLSYDVGRGDLVVFERPSGVGGGQEDDLIKRVIALPGEVVKFVEGVVYIDNRRLHEPYLESPDITVGGMPPGCEAIIDGGCLIGADEVFVMGDNRENSTDSRAFGPIAQHLIVGQAFLRLWPVTDFGRL